MKKPKRRLTPNYTGRKGRNFDCCEIYEDLYNPCESQVNCCEPQINYCKPQINCCEPQQNCCEVAQPFCVSNCGFTNYAKSLCGKQNRGIGMIFFVPLLFLITMLFLTWSFFNIYVNITLGSSDTILYGIIFFIIGSYIGKGEVYTWIFCKSPCREPVIPRNYSTIIFVMLSFILKFFWAYFYINYTNIPCLIYVVDMVTSSLVTGFFIARTLAFFKAYLQTSPPMTQMVGRTNTRCRR